MSEPKISQDDMYQWVRISAHDLRGSIQRIAMASELLEAMTEGPAAKLLPKIAKAVESAKAQIDELVDFASAQSGSLPVELSTFCLQALVSDIISQLTSAQGKSLELESEGEYKVQADKTLVKKAIRSLLARSTSISQNAAVSLRVSSEGAETTVVIESQATAESEPSTRHRCELAFADAAIASQGGRLELRDTPWSARLTLPTA